MIKIFHAKKKLKYLEYNELFYLRIVSYDNFNNNKLSVSMNQYKDITRTCKVDSLELTIRSNQITCGSKLISSSFCVTI